MIKKISIIPMLSFVLVSSFLLTGCLKTRAQIKKSDSTQQAESSTETEHETSAKHSASYELDEVKHELTRLSGKLEEVDHLQHSQNYGELKEYLARLDGRISELEKNQVLIMGELKALKDEKVQAVKDAAVSSSDLMVQGYQMLSDKKYEEAAEKFRLLISKNIKGKEAVEAHFGLGEAEYGVKNYKKAIVQYSKVQELSSKSARIPTSLYKIGLSFQKLNMGKEAKGFFAELVERYPKSPEAKKVKLK